MFKELKRSWNLHLPILHVDNSSTEAVAGYVGDDRFPLLYGGVSEVEQAGSPGTLLFQQENNVAIRVAHHGMDQAHHVDGQTVAQLLVPGRHTVENINIQSNFDHSKLWGLILQVRITQSLQQ